MKGTLLVGLMLIQGILGVEISGESSVTVAEGDTIALTCEDDQGDNLYWVFNGIELEEDHRHIVTAVNVGGTSSNYLSVEGATPEDAGRYECKSRTDPIFGVAEVTVSITASNGDGTAGGGDHVEIVEPSEEESTAAIGHSFTLKCQADVHGSVIWYKGDERLQDETGGFVINEGEDQASHVRISMLTKDDASVEDSGTYTCMEAGSDDNSDSVEITVTAEDEGEGDPEGEGEVHDEDDGDSASALVPRTVFLSLGVLVPLIIAKNRF